MKFLFKNLGLKNNYKIVKVAFYFINKNQIKSLSFFIIIISCLLIE